MFPARSRKTEAFLHPTLLQSISTGILLGEIVSHRSHFEG